MAGRDNVLYGAAVAASTAGGTVIPIPCMYGVENVRQGYGTPKLKSVRAYYSGLYASDTVGVPVTIKNSNWVDEAGLTAQRFSNTTALNKASLSHMRGRDKILSPNTAWTVYATIPGTTASAGYIWVLFEIEYSDIPGINTEDTAGSPVLKKCSATGVTAAAATPVTIGTFDNLLQNVTYVLSEVAASGLASDGAFVIIEGFSNQKGLTRIIPAKESGLADQIGGSVYLTKQTYNVSVLNYTALTAAGVTVQMEMIASAN